MKVLNAICLINLSIFQQQASAAFVIRGSTQFVPSTTGRVAVLKISPGGSSDEETGSSEPQASAAPAASNAVTPEEMLPQSIPPPPPAPASTSSSKGVVQQGPNGSTPGWFRSKFPGLPYNRLPDYLTYMRCAAIPILCAIFYMPDRHVESGLLFAFASFTDFLDGYWARRWDVSTAFGAFLDPVADKLMVSTALILLSGRHGAIVALPTCVILARELAVSALREWMAQRGSRDSVKVGFQGKLKTALTMVSLTLMLLVPDIGVKESWLTNLFLPSLASLYVCALITVTSGSVYFRAALPVLMGKEQ